MAKKKNLDKKLSTVVKRFIALVERNGISIDQAIVFGSRAKGKQRADSDIDVCLVSEKFGQDEIEELQFLLKQSRAVDDRIEPLPLSRADFENETTPLVREVKKHGQTVF